MLLECRKSQISYPAIVELQITTSGWFEPVCVLGIISFPGLTVEVARTNTE
jgi:hypothetical protein